VDADNRDPPFPRLPVVRERSCFLVYKPHLQVKKAAHAAAYLQDLPLGIRTGRRCPHTMPYGTWVYSGTVYH
jgi:ABC-type antimicrobial peptide transport system ATPase subunit